MSKARFGLALLIPALTTTLAYAEPGSPVHRPRETPIRSGLIDVDRESGEFWRRLDDPTADRDGNPQTSPVCTVGPANCQEREPIDGPAFRLNIGRGNGTQIKRFDEFRLSADGYVKEVCFRIEYLFAVTCAQTMDDPADPDCGCDPIADPVNCTGFANGFCEQLLDPAIHAEFLTKFQVTIWDDFLGLPSAIVAGPYRRDFGTSGAQDDNTQVPIAGGLNVTQALSGDSIGFNTPTFFEYGINAAIPAADQVLLSANLCYWMELDQDTGGCFALLAGSPQAGPDVPGSIGNMQSLTFDATVRTIPDPALDFRPFDIHLCILAEDTSGPVGAGTVVNLLPSNDPAAVTPCTVKIQPINDGINGASILTCGDTVANFDNTWADFDSAFPEGACRKIVTEAFPSSAGDLWWIFTASQPDAFDTTTASAKLSLCATDTTLGLGGGDALLQIYAFNTPATPPANITLADIFEIGCNDDRCGNIPEITLSNLILGDPYIVRMHSFDYRSQGIYTLSLQCPAPFVTNDTCIAAEEVPLAGPGFTDEAGIMIEGSTIFANVENTPAGCESTLRIEARNSSNQIISNTVYYKLQGQGSLIRLNTDFPVIGKDFDTALSVFCSEDDTCNNLACIGSNDDIDSQTSKFKSDFVFCAILGKTYYIVVSGGTRFRVPTEAGDFNMLVQQLRDSVNQPIACCANGNECATSLAYEVPPNAINEISGLIPGAPAEFCNDGSSAPAPIQPVPDIAGTNNGCAGPPNEFGNFNGKFGKFFVGQAVEGSLYSNNGGRDTDEYIFEGLNPNGDETIVDWSWQSEGVVRNRVEAVFSNWFNCPGLALGCYTQNHDFPNERSDQRTHHEAWGSRDNQGIDFGNPGFVGTMAFTFRQRVPGAGTPCGVRDRYWFKLNEAFDAETCPAISSPIGTMTIDNLANELMGEVTWGDWDNERHQPTFGDPLWTGLVDETFGFATGTSGTGKCGSTCSRQFDVNQSNPQVCNGAGDFVDIFAGEPCELRKPGTFCQNERDLSGCFFPTPVDGDFMLLRPNHPIIGFIDGFVGFGPNRDIDFYKFRIGSAADVAAGRQFSVTLDIESGYAMQAFIQEDNCRNNVFNTIPYGIAATTGECGSRTLRSDDVMVLTAGVYVVQVLWGDLFGFSGVCILDNAPCSYTGDPINDPSCISKYVLRVNAEPIPDCTVDITGAVQKIAEAFEGCPTGVDPLYEERPSNCPGEGNDGCAVGTFTADTITSGETVWGQLFTMYEPANTQQNWLTDQDYYQFTVPTGQLCRLRYSAVANGPVRVQVANVGAGGSLCTADRPRNGRGANVNPRGTVRILSAIDATACDVAGQQSPTEGEVYLSEGAYALVVSPGTVQHGLAAEDLNCSLGNQLTYTLTMQTEALGSCVVGDGFCKVTTATECLGTFIPNSTGLEQYFVESLIDPAFNSIAATAANLGFTQDDRGLVDFAIPPFFFHGEFFTLLSISDNGYMVLSNPPSAQSRARALPLSDNSNSPFPRPMGDVGGPNNLIAPLWHDWDPSQGGAVFAQTIGDLTTIEWSNMTRAANTRHTTSFQAVLHHYAAEIEFVYGSMTDGDISTATPNSLVTAALEGAVFVAGVEDRTGLQGSAVAVETLGVLNGGLRVLLSPGAGLCDVGCCLGDASKSGFVGEINFADITAVLGNWQIIYQTTGEGDANCDGVVNFSDITSVLSNWLNTCP